MTSDETIAALRAALAVSPDNVPLRTHLATALLALGRSADAEACLRDGLRLAPESVPLQLALARAFRAQQKFSAAHVVLDELVRRDDAVAQALVERARTLFAEGRARDAVREYRKALDADPEVADAELGERLGIDGAAAADPWTEFADGRIPADQGARGGEPLLEPVRSDIDFSKLGGMEDVKRDIRRKVILPLQNPELFKSYGKPVGGGILLYGPPGCGKTHLARATAGEIDANFLEVGIHDVLDMWIGQSERNLHTIFEVARDNTPCVLFFDEADALGASRSDLRNSAGRQTINQFLAELDGLKHDNDGILVLAATNAPWQMDPAFRRPGRFDRIVFVPPPDEPAREAILRIHLDGKPQAKLDLKTLAKKTEGFSGADLKAIVDDAIEEALERALETGEVAPLTDKDLVKARKARRPSTGEWFRTVRNHVLYANDDGLYDVIKPYLKL